MYRQTESQAEPQAEPLTRTRFHSNFFVRAFSRVKSSRAVSLLASASLLLAAATTHAQFGAQPVGAATGNQSVTVTASVSGTVSSVEILSLGSPTGDFAAGTGTSNCASATLALNATCSESITFTPAKPGLRLGAVVLVGTPTGGSGQSVLGTAYLSGIGVGGLGVLVEGNMLPVAGQLGLYTSVGDNQPATQAELKGPASHFFSRRRSARPSHPNR